VSLGILSVTCRTLRSTQVKIPADSNVEMTWKVFGGAYHDIYYALLKERCMQDGFNVEDAEILAEQFRLHLHRGIGYLFVKKEIRNISTLISKIMTGME